MNTGRMRIMIRKALTILTIITLVASIVSITHHDSAYAETKAKTTEKKDAKTKTSKTSITDVTVEIVKGSGTKDNCGSKCLNPSQSKIKVGGTVTWKNQDDRPHTITSGTIQSGPDGKFNSDVIKPGESFKKKFDQAGEYKYFDIIHGWIQGKISVN